MLPGRGRQPLPARGRQPLPARGQQPLPGRGRQPFPGQCWQPFPGQCRQPLPGQCRQQMLACCLVTGQWSVLGITPILGGKRTLTGDIKIVESLDTVIANVVYENALPFNVADSSSFAVMVEQCIKFGQQNPGRKYKVPNRRRIGGALLDSAYEDTGASVQPIIDRAKKYGGTLTSDGWSDVHRRPITNFMFVTRESAVRNCSVTAWGCDPDKARVARGRW